MTRVAEPKTKPTKASVAAFLKRTTDQDTHGDCLTLVKLMRQATGKEPRMWGPSMVGFGSYHYVYASGREGDWPLIGFSPRKEELTIYIMAGFDQYPELMKKLGRHRTGKSCLYVKRLADLDMKVLKALIIASVRHMKRRHA